MSTDRHPLADALDDAERSGADYEVPVALVRARVRHRRRVRAAARGGVACGAVVAVALALPAVLGGPGGVPPAAQGDWPAQFGRCGERVTVADDDEDAPVAVTLEPQDTIGADRLSMTSTWVRYDPEAVSDVGPAAFEALLLRDGVVVAVEDGAGRVVVPASELPEDPSVPGVGVWSHGAVLASCAQVPDGTGDPRVPAGVYELVVSQTVRWRAADGSAGSTRVSRQLRVTVTEFARPAAEPLPEECGSDTATLAARAGPEANPFAVTLDADVPAEVAAGGELRFTVSATNEGRSVVDAYVGRPSVLLTRDGRVVATPPGPSELALSAGISPGASIGYDATSSLVDCATGALADAFGPDEGHPLAPGDYEVWVGLDLLLTGRSLPAGESGDVHLLAGPWPVTLR
ncbi:hypothetical protein [Cellulomonas phragmiteti]|uniref:DUF11 domain-containing protein n=1 Tax=Cellulomonas phragmiteti TaxID=478780 RepID=A0ABQ4DME5_9CELL|nr:hypothetical protein [Cellulomonas phragmiteti]GIG40530.1 hypothetical protein Cph01nite_22920 [Cellulomonas phragmiteti]